MTTIAAALKQATGHHDAIVQRAEVLQTLDRQDSLLECRRCLEPGLERTCCGNYYCNKCFCTCANLGIYNTLTHGMRAADKFADCPSCGTRIVLSDTAIQAPPAGVAANVCSIVFVLSLYTLLLGLGPATWYFWHNIPVSLFGYKCFGVWEHREEWLCWRAPDLMNGTTPAQQLWERCPHSFETGCICGRACVIDQCVYAATGGRLGVDFVAADLLPATVVMHEDFEPAMHEHFWTNLTATIISSACGTVSGNNTLRFRADGAISRSAATSDFDMQHGGEIEFHMIYGDGTKPGCASVELGNVRLAYSNDQGVTWNDWKEYPRAVFRKSNFTHVREVFPAALSAGLTRFKWYQPTFWVGFDVFALDAIKVFSYPPPDWQVTSKWTNFTAAVQNRITVDQCCLDCNNCLQPQITATQDQCQNTPGFQQLPVYSAKEHEMLVLLWGLLAVTKLVSELLIVIRYSMLNGVLRVVQTWLKWRLHRASVVQEEPQKLTVRVPTPEPSPTPSREEEPVPESPFLADQSVPSGEIAAVTDVQRSFHVLHLREEEQVETADGAEQQQLQPMLPHVIPSDGANPQPTQSQRGQQVQEAAPESESEPEPAQEPQDDPADLSEEDIDEDKDQVFKPSYGWIWGPTYLAAGVGVPLLLMIAALQQGPAWSKYVLLRFGIFSVPMYMGLPIALALCVDGVTILSVAAEVMSMTPATRHTFRVMRPARDPDVDMLQYLKSSVLLLDRGFGRSPVRVTLNNIMFLREGSRAEAGAMAACYVFASQPLASIAIALAPELRWYSLSLMLVAGAKVVYGPGYLWKLALLFNEMNSQIYARKQRKRLRFAGSCCGWRCRQSTLLIGSTVAAWLFVGFGLYLAGIAFLPSGAHLRDLLPLISIIGVSAIMFIALVAGSTLGCTHTLPVHVIPTLTSWDNLVLVHVAVHRKSEMFASRAVCAHNHRRAPGDGSCVPLRDQLAKWLGVLPEGEVHFTVPRDVLQYAVIYAAVKQPQSFLRAIDMDRLVATARERDALRMRAAPVQALAKLKQVDQVAAIQETLRLAEEGRRQPDRILRADPEAVEAAEREDRYNRAQWATYKAHYDKSRDPDAEVRKAAAEALKVKRLPPPRARGNNAFAAVAGPVPPVRDPQARRAAVTITR